MESDDKYECTCRAAPVISAPVNYRLIFPIVKGCDATSAANGIYNIFLHVISFIIYFLMEYIINNNQHLNYKFLKT